MVLYKFGYFILVVNMMVRSGLREVGFKEVRLKAVTLKKLG